MNTNKMTFDEFLAVMYEEIPHHLPKSLKIASMSTHTVEKAGGITFTAMNICIEGCNIAPNIYLEPYYEDYLNGRTEYSIAEEIGKNKAFKDLKSFDTSLFTDFNTVKDRIVFQLVSDADFNQKYLANRVKIKMSNTTICTIFAVDLSDKTSDEGSATIGITYDHMKMWDVSIDTIQYYAKINTPRIRPVNFFDLSESFLENHSLEGSDNVPASPVMVVVSNKYKVDGACAILYDNVADKLREAFGGDFFVLPSSRHECIAVPAIGDVNELYNSVYDINRAAVSKEDYLADDVYLVKDNLFYSVLRKNVAPIPSHAIDEEVYE